MSYGNSIYNKIKHKMRPKRLIYIPLNAGYHQLDKNGNYLIIDNEYRYMETIDLKKTNLQKAYNGGCDEVKRTLKTLYPDFQFERVLPKTWDEFERILDIGLNDYLSRYTYNSYSSRNTPEYSKFWGATIPNKYVALRKLELLRDYYNDGWVPVIDSNVSFHRIICRHYDGRLQIGDSSIGKFLTFKNEILRDEFMINFKDLIKEAGDLI